MGFPRFLKIAVVPTSGIFHLNITEKNKLVVTKGSEKLFLELLAEHFKFEYEILAPKDKEWGTLKNGSWTGVIGLVRRREAHMGIGKISITESRSAVVDFSYPYDIEDLTFAAPLPEQISKTTAFLFTFSPPLWITVLVVLVVTSIVFQFVQSKTRTYTKKANRQCCALIFYGYVLQQPLNIKLATKGSTVVFLTWLLSARFITFGYSAAFLSFLTLPWEETGIETIEQLSSAVAEGSHNCFTIQGASYISTLTQSKQKVIEVISSHIIDKQWFVEPKKKNIMAIIKKQRNVLIAPRNYLNSQFDGVRLSRDSFFALTRAIVLRKDFCCKKELDEFLLRMCAAGIYQKHLNDHMFKLLLSIKMSTDYQTVSKEKKLCLKDLAGVFFCFIIGCVLSLVVFTAEVLSGHSRKCVGKSVCQKNIPSKICFGKTAQSHYSKNKHFPTRCHNRTVKARQDKNLTNIAVLMCKKLQLLKELSNQ